MGLHARYAGRGGIVGGMGRTLPVSRLVLRIAFRHDIPERAKEKAQRGGPEPKYSDGEIREMRRLFEVCGVSREEIARRFPGLPYSSLTAILNYNARAST